MPTQWIRCDGCKGEVGIPSDLDASSVTCPKCGSIVGIEAGTIKWRPASNASQGSMSQKTAIPNGKTIADRGAMRIAGILLMLFAVAAGVASFNFGAGHPWTIEGAMIALALNPILIVGLPLGFYWWYWSQPGFKCPHCGRRNLWRYIDPIQHPCGSAVSCVSCSRPYRIPFSM